jgi:deoxyribonuclease-4
MLRFAVAGVPLSTPRPGGTVVGMKHAASLGIRAMEIEWVQAVPTNIARMEEIRRTAEEHDIALTVHAPYYVNFNSSKVETYNASIRRVLSALSMGERAGARSVCVHAAFYAGNPAKAHDGVRRAVDTIMQSKQKLFPHGNLALETMGKLSQWGSLEEVLAVSKEFGIFPCIDSAHMHARTNGAWNTAKEWNTLFDEYESHLGTGSLKTMHMHYCGIAYGERGEKHHLPLLESDANWMDFLHVLKNREIGGNLVIESPILEGDTLLLQNAFAKLQ